MATLCDKCPHRPHLKDGHALCNKGHSVVVVRVYEPEVSGFTKRNMYRDDTEDVCSDFPHVRTTRFERILRDNYPL